jgi:hypothetical protein
VVGNMPYVVREEHWYNDRDHRLAYCDVLNADLSRDQSEWDEAGNPIREIHFGPYGVDGTTVKRYYPGTQRLRLDSVSEWTGTVGKRYRTNGTLFSQETRRYDVLYVTRYDEVSTPSRALFEQTWRRSEVKTNALTRDFWELTEIKELASDGSSARLLRLAGGMVRQETRLSVTVDGAFYDAVDRYYNDSGLLAKTRCYREHQMIREVDQAATDKVVADVPAFELAFPERFDELPIPLPDPES